MPGDSGCQIHSTAVISEAATIGAGCRVGPYVVIEGRVEVDEETVIGPHAFLQGPTVIGKRNRIIGPCAIGTDPQDLKYRGEESTLSIGDDNIVREFVTIHRGTEGGGWKTTVGSGNLIMAGAHIAHDCRIGDGTILGNAATLAGHVLVDDYSRIGAFSGVHQFCRVGKYSFIGAYSVITRDTLPFIKTVGDRNQAKIYGINQVGLERCGFSAERIAALKKAYRWLFNRGLKVKEALEQMRNEGIETEDVKILLEFIESSERGFVR